MDNQFYFSIFAEILIIACLKKKSYCHKCFLKCEILYKFIPLKTKIVHCRKICFILFCLFSINGYAQKLALKTNLVQWATISPNLGAEFVLNNHLSLDISASFNVWDPYSSLDLKHALLQPELRYWFGRPMSRHFLGITTFYSSYDILQNHKYHYGDAAAAGMTYGYDVVINKHWNFEASVGIGALYYRQFKYNDTETRPQQINDSGWALVPIKLAISFVYILR